MTASHPRIHRPRRIDTYVTYEEKAAYDEDARLLGFAHCGTDYIRWLLEGRHKGTLAVLDPAFMSMAQIAGRVMGEIAGQIIARAEQAYLEGGVK